MGVPPYVLRVVRCAIPGLADCVIGRLDMVRKDGDYKLLEYNADAWLWLRRSLSTRRFASMRG
jgi:glutathionylspermidine synthase